ncbi:unnamed protein product, partial [Heterosigma akashiwo]
QKLLHPSCCGGRARGRGRGPAAARGGPLRAHGPGDARDERRRGRRRRAQVRARLLPLLGPAGAAHPVVDR